MQDANELLGKTKTKNSQFKSNISDLKSKVESQNLTIETQEGQIDSLSQEVKSLNDIISSINAENASLKKALEENLTESEQYNLIMTQEIEKLNEELKNKSTELSKSYSNV